MGEIGSLPLSATIISDELEAVRHAKGFINATSHVADPHAGAHQRADLEELEAPPDLALESRERFAPASPLERAGFELPVPERGQGFEPRSVACEG
jgi:hypothetical protein